MMRLRLFTIVLIVWLTVLFNMSRPGIFIGDIDLSLQLSPVVYVIAAAVVLLILLLPDLGQVRLWKLLLALLLIYGVLRFTFTPFNPVKPKITTYFIVTEVLALVGTVVAARFLSLVVSNVEHAVETVLASQEKSRILPKSDGFETFNKELERARRFTRPLGFIYINIGILPEMNGTINSSGLEVAFQRRYIQNQIAHIVEATLDHSSSICWYNDGLLICMPEMEFTGLSNTAKIIAHLVKGYLAKSVVIGIATFPDDGLILDDIIAMALRCQVSYADLEEDSFIDDDPDDEITEKITPVTVKEVVQESTSRERSVQASYQPPALPQPTLSRVATNAGGLTLSIGFRLPWNLTEILPNPAKLFVDNSVNVAKTDDPQFWVNRLPYQSQTSRAAYRLVKRVIDIAVVLLTAPFTLPLFALVMLAVHLDSEGPIIFVQERTGIGGHRFNMYKFRTMVKDAEELLKTLAAKGLAELDERGKLAAPLKLNPDPRITRVGRILRKTSLDELPQLFNVLRGDMSLVGPRPTSWDVNSYTLPQTGRLSAQPGITGLWQVYGRGSTDFGGWVRWDTLYIEKMSLSLDFRILLLTVKQVLARKGAR